MLSYLRIRGLALLDDVELEFAPGMNVLTGETGAGKSIIVGALSLLRGARARAEVVREGDESAIVDAHFVPSPSVWGPLRETLLRHGIEGDDEAEDGSLVLRRVVPRNGRGRAFVQSTLVTRAVLAEVGEHLLDICSQHEHHFLTHPARHLDVLDAFARLDEAGAAHAERWRARQDAAADLADLEQRAAQRLQRIDVLRFQIDELERVDPRPGEHDALRRRLTLLRDARRWAELARTTQDVLYEADDAVAPRLAALADRARAGAADVELLSAIAERLIEAQVACEDAARLAARLGDDIDAGPAELEQAEERMHELETLRRKHGVDLDELGARLSVMRGELDELEHAEERVAQARARHEGTADACRQTAQVLHGRRVAAAAGLSSAVEAELGALHLPGARLTVEVETADEHEPGARGFDRVAFGFSANPGEPLGPLSRVASGGELSRVLLAIKSALAAEDRVATYVFDEVDAGVGGQVAEAIGRRLRRAAAAHQVLCVTHLPQIAAFADAHVLVDKSTRGGRTRTRVRTLDAEARVDEIARMLGGNERSAKAHARELLTREREAPAKTPRKARAAR
jgi:DNA repair protein RecN (Recombination protein N)